MRNLAEKLIRRGRSGARTLRELAQDYFQTLIRRGLADDTRRNTTRHVTSLVSFLERRRRRLPAHISARDLEAFLAAVSRQRTATGRRIGAPLHPNTVVRYQDSVRVFVRWLRKQGELLLDPTQDLRLKTKRSLPRVLSSSEIDQLFAETAGSSAIAVRDRAILELFYSSGLRRGELASLDLADLDLAAGEMVLRQTKGGRWRRVPVGERAIAAISEYLREARAVIPALAIREPRALFLCQRGTRLSAFLIHQMVVERARQAGLTGAVSPHTLRHTAAVHLLKGGADVRHVQELLGHVSVTTTAHYTQLALTDLKSEHERCHPRPRIRA